MVAKGFTLNAGLNKYFVLTNNVEFVDINLNEITIRMVSGVEKRISLDSYENAIEMYQEIIDAMTRE